MLVERSSVQPSDERLDGKESRQDTRKHADKSKDNGDTGRHARRSFEVLLQWSTTITDVAVSKLLHSENTASSPPNGEFAFEDLPILHESGSPQNESSGVVRGVGCPEQPESTADCGDNGESFGVSCEEVKI